MTSTQARPTRRQVAAGAAWSIPVVGAASMAPLAAASHCPFVTLSWGAMTITTNSSTNFVATGSISTTQGLNAVTLTSARPAGYAQPTLSTGPDGGYGSGGVYPYFLGTDTLGLPGIAVPNSTYLEMHGSEGCRDYTMTFSLPVQDLVLPFADIDGFPGSTTVESITLLTTGYVELYQGTKLTQTGSTYTATAGTNSRANDTSLNCTTSGTGYNCASESGDLTVMYDGPLTSVSWRYCKTAGVDLSTDLFAVSFRPC